MERSLDYIQPTKIEKDSYIWNTIAGMLNAFQSVIILMVLTRTLGLDEAGIFTIAYATAVLALTVGKYGMRNYQVTDINDTYSFNDYKCSRIITLLAMLVASSLYVLYTILIQGYNHEKAAIVMVMCILKGIDAYEDIYHGMYQQKGRLDIASKLLAIRMALTIISLCIFLEITKNQLLSLGITTLISFVFFVVSIMKTLGKFKIEKKKVNSKQVIRLLAENFPLFSSSFLMLYIGNAPKYAIDGLLSSEMQACYGFIAMPIFVIGLLNQFIYQPILTRMAVEWNDRNIKSFKREIYVQCLWIALLNICVMILGYLLGIPVLSLLYSTDLHAYKMEFLILLLGGGLYALVGYFTTVLTIMRYQNTLTVGYALVSIFAFCLSPWFVRKSGIMGASVLYLALMTLLTVIFLFILIYEINRMNRKIIK